MSEEPKLYFRENGTNIEKRCRKHVAWAHGLFSLTYFFVSASCAKRVNSEQRDQCVTNHDHGIARSQVKR